MGAGRTREYVGERSDHNQEGWRGLRDQGEEGPDAGKYAEYKQSIH